MRKQNSYITLILGIFFLCFIGTAVKSDDIAIIDNKPVIVQSIVSPRVKIVGAEDNIPLGEVVVLRAELEDAHIEIAKNISYSWVLPDGKRAFGLGTNEIGFGAGLKKTSFDVSLDVEILYEVDQKQIIKHTGSSVAIKISDSIDPEPNPPNPDTSLKGLTQRWIKEDPHSPELIASAKVINLGFKEVIRDKDFYKTPQELLTTLKKANNKYLQSGGFNPNIWDDWGVKLQEHLWEMYNIGRLKTMSEYIAVLQEISDALDTIK